MLGEALVETTTLKISPKDFATWLQEKITKGQQKLELVGIFFTLKSVLHNPPAVVGMTENGSVTIEVIGHVVVATFIKDGYPNP